MAVIDIIPCREAEHHVKASRHTVWECPQHFSHPIRIKEATLVELGWQSKSPHSTQVHKAGCAHERKVGADHAVQPFDLTSPPLADDWYYVAPCARKA